MVGTVRGFSPWMLNKVNDVNGAGASAPGPSVGWCFLGIPERFVECRQVAFGSMLCVPGLLGRELARLGLSEARLGRASPQLLGDWAVQAPSRGVVAVLTVSVPALA